MDGTAISRALMRIAHKIVERFEDIERLYLVAIPNGGVPLARQLADMPAIAVAGVLRCVVTTT